METLRRTVIATLLGISLLAAADCTAGRGLGGGDVDAQSGDEPPIRVKNGSVEFNLVAARPGEEWEQVKPGEWRIKAQRPYMGSRISVLVLTSVVVPSCKMNWSISKGNNRGVRFTVSTGSGEVGTVDVTVRGSKTHVTSQLPLAIRGKQLCYPECAPKDGEKDGKDESDAAFISQLSSFNGSTVTPRCKLPDRAALEDVIVFDPDRAP